MLLQLMSPGKKNWGRQEKNEDPHCEEEEEFEKWRWFGCDFYEGF